MKQLERSLRIAKLKQEENKIKHEVWEIKHPYFFLLLSKIFDDKKIPVDTFTKKWMNRLMWFSCFWITMSYFLVLKGYGQYAESLSQTVCITIIGAMIPYLIKSFFETYFEKKNQIDVNEINQNINTGLDSMTQKQSNSDAVG